MSSVQTSILPLFPPILFYPSNQTLQLNSLIHREQKSLFSSADGYCEKYNAAPHNAQSARNQTHVQIQRRAQVHRNDVVVLPPPVYRA